jgi:D-3-phosphoglycerate dehydrogenase
LPVFFRAQQQREFVRRPTRDLTGATVGIVGMGGVGRRLVEVLAAFKTKILATDWYPIDKPPKVESLWPPERLDEMLPLVDVLILSVPLTDRTRGMIGAREISLLKPGSLLVNVARGPLVVEEALVAALRSGHLAGAAVDVTATEPLPATSALWELPQVIITPHVGGQSARRIDNMTDFFCENLRRDQAGEPLRNLVDKRLGFPMRVAGQ